MSRMEARYPGLVAAPPPPVPPVPPASPHWNPTPTYSYVDPATGQTVSRVGQAPHHRRPAPAIGGLIDFAESLLGSSFGDAARATERFLSRVGILHEMAKHQTTKIAFPRGRARITIDVPAAAFETALEECDDEIDVGIFVSAVLDEAKESVVASIERMR